MPEPPTSDEGARKRRARGRPSGFGTRVERGRDLARLSASTGRGLLSARLRQLAGGEPDAVHLETAEKMLEVLGGMKGMAMKVGQLASFVDLDLPPEVAETYQAVLAELRDAAPPTDPASVAEVVRAEFGAPPERVFAAWDPQPVAAASIGQVHRATLPSGEAVAVKVQYPGVAEAVESDLANAEMFAPFARLISPNLKVKPLTEELRARVVDELDYQREAQYQQAFAERYDGHPFIRVPRVYADFSRPRVLTAAFVDGLGFEEMMQATTRAERRRYGEIIFRFVYGSLHRFRLFNADPHPGNYLFPGDGTVVFLDFGSTKLFGSRIRDDIQHQLKAVIDGDTTRLLATMREAGFVPERYEPDPELLMSWYRSFNEPVLHDAEWEYTPEFARRVIRSTTDMRLGYVDLLRRMNLPPDYLTLNRIQWGVNSILGRLRAKANWQRVMAEFWDDAPPATELGHQERPFIDASTFRA